MNTSEDMCVGVYHTPASPMKQIMGIAGGLTAGMAAQTVVEEITAGLPSVISIPVQAALYAPAMFAGAKAGCTLYDLSVRVITCTLLKKPPEGVTTVRAAEETPAPSAAQACQEPPISVQETVVTVTAPDPAAEEKLEEPQKGHSKKSEKKGEGFEQP